jgi:multiple sugar transport system permease protein
MGFGSFVQVIAPGNLPAVFAIIAFWTGAGGWIVIMYGALNNISNDVMEAARIDGANAVQIALRIQLPLLRKWISYMGIMSLAAGTQLFVEPQLLSQASNAVVPGDYSLNQLAYQYAFTQNDFNGAAAISILLLIVSLALSAVFVTRGGLFEKD